MTFAPGSKLEKIESEVFLHSGIESVRIPKNVQVIRERAFNYCERLKRVVFEKGSKLRVIGEDAFDKCTKLAKIDLPVGLKSIESGAF